MNGFRKTERGYEVYLRYGGCLYFDRLPEALWAWLTY